MKDIETVLQWLEGSEITMAYWDPKLDQFTEFPESHEGEEDTVAIIATKKRTKIDIQDGKSENVHRVKQDISGRIPSEK